MTPRALVECVLLLLISHAAARGNYSNYSRQVYQPSSIENNHSVIFSDDALIQTSGHGPLPPQTSVESSSNQIKGEILERQGGSQLNRDGHLPKKKKRKGKKRDKGKKKKNVKDDGEGDDREYHQQRGNRGTADLERPRPPRVARNCTSLQAPDFGSVSTSLGQRHGSLAIYTCASGLQLVGPTSRICIDGRWTGSRPACGAFLYEEIEAGSDSTDDEDQIGFTEELRDEPTLTRPLGLMASCLDSVTWTHPTGGSCENYARYGSGRFGFCEEDGAARWCPRSCETCSNRDAGHVGYLPSSAGRGSTSNLEEDSMESSTPLSPSISENGSAEEPQIVVLAFGDSLTSGKVVLPTGQIEYNPYSLRLARRLNATLDERVHDKSSRRALTNPSVEVVEAGANDQQSSEMLPRLENILARSYVTEMPNSFELGIILAGLYDTQSAVSTYQSIVQLHRLLHEHGILSAVVTLPAVNPYEGLSATKARRKNAHIEQINRMLREFASGGCPPLKTDNIQNCFLVDLDAAISNRTTPEALRSQSERLRSNDPYLLSAAGYDLLGDLIFNEWRENGLVPLVGGG